MKRSSYAWVVMIILLPVWITTEGLKMLKAFVSRQGFRWDALHVLILVLVILAFFWFFLGGY